MYKLIEGNRNLRFVKQNKNIFDIEVITDRLMLFLIS